MLRVAVESGTRRKRRSHISCAQRQNTAPSLLTLSSSSTAIVSAMPPAKSKRTKVDMGEMSEEEDDGPSIAKKRMLAENLVKLTESQLSAKRTATGIIRVHRDPHDDITDPPISPLTAVVETARLIAPESLSQKSQRTGSSGRPNFKAFVKKGRRVMHGGHSPASQHSLVEIKLMSYDRNEYQVMIAFPFSDSDITLLPLFTVRPCLLDSG